MLLRESGKRLARILARLKKEVKVGVSTKALDTIAEQLIREGGDEPAFLNYTPYGARHPFPASLCISLNEEIVHGIPSARVINEGDLVSLDLGLEHRGMITDAAITVPVGKVPADAMRLVHETERALYEGIKAARMGGRMGDVSQAIERIAKAQGYGIVRELGGHGVGHKVHEEPYVPNYGKKGTGPILKAGMVLALEPMFMLGAEDIRVLPDGYTVIARDKSLSAHFEHTIVITEKGPEILTEV